MAKGNIVPAAWLTEYRSTGTGTQDWLRLLLWLIHGYPQQLNLLWQSSWRAWAPAWLMRTALVALWYTCRWLHEMNKISDGIIGWLDTLQRRADLMFLGKVYYSQYQQTKATVYMLWHSLMCQKYNIVIEIHIIIKFCTPFWMQCIEAAAVLW